MLAMAAASGAASGAVPILKEWSGRIETLPALPGFAADATTLAAVWAHLKAPGEVPAVDFRKQLVLVSAVRSSVVRMRPNLDEAGTMRRNVVAAPDQPAFHTWVLCLVPSAGVVSVDGVPIRASQSCAGLKASLHAPESVAAGTAPAFTLRIRNDAAEPRPLLEVRHGRREDLEVVYYPVTIRPAAGKLDLPRHICDPGVVSAEDYFLLAPGATAEIRLTKSCFDLTKLAPGIYEARATLRQVYTPTDPSCETRPVRFEVRK
jgi:hypothetical protein